VRSKAVVELEQLGALAAPDLRAALQTKLSLDVERQLERLLDRLQHPSLAPHPNIVRGLRALRALGQIDTPEARQLLKVLADGRPTFWVTQAANAILENK
jgi:hypothetical protein